MRCGLFTFVQTKWISHCRSSMVFRVYLLTLLLILCAVQKTETVSINDLNEIKDGVKFAETMTTAMKPLEFTEFLASAASKALPFISATLKFVNLIFSHIGNSESPELLQIKRLYNEMNRRFDIVDNELLDIKKLINWTRVSNQFSKIEREITTVSIQFKIIYDGPLAIRKSEKSYFMNAFESTCLNCALDLYHGIMGVNKGLSDDILQTAMTSLQYDRPKTQMFMLGIFKLLLLGLNNELAYRKLKFGNADYLFIKKQWESRLTNVTEKMKRIDEAVKIKYHDQAEKDIARISMQNLRSVRSNHNFSEYLYDHLVQKYDWRDWLVVVYRPIWGVQNHVNHICDGYRRYGMYERDVLVASVDQSKDPINTTIADAITKGITTTHTTWTSGTCHTTGNYDICSPGFWTTNKRNALEVYNLIPSETRDCNMYSSMGVIDSWVDLWYQGKSERLVHHRTPGSNSYSIHLFG
ncbi:Hypothetical predicted protein [Mytilus galloprovincialis]|uniref:Uncharacterized protein n=1 Tax=Mytilus galloprovincialis TaxID=29158 RepID=A0A8B6GRY4_MYTGA|nr:Hypothetical predicted protein [Mytilus galloprovincialis]